MTKEVSVSFQTDVTIRMDDVKEFFSAYSFNDDAKEQQLKEILDSMDDWHDARIYTDVEEDYVSVDVDFSEEEIEEALDDMSTEDRNNFLKRQMEYDFDVPEIDNLEDQEKFKICCQMFDKYSLEELQKL